MILTLKYIINNNYPQSSSFNLLSNINTSFAALESIRLGSQNKYIINVFNFIITNDSTINRKIGFGKLMLYHNLYQEKEFSLLKQLNSKKFIETSKKNVQFKDDFSGELILGTDFTGMNIEESKYLELPDSENSLNSYLQSIYVEDATITIKKQQKDF